MEVRYGPGDPQYIGYSRNLSRSGLMVGARRVFAPGTVLNLEIKLLAGTFRLRGEVIWAREGPVEWIPTGRVGMGITFLDPPQEFLTALPEAARGNVSGGAGGPPGTGGGTP
jgi:hypothetical protein